MTPKRLIFLLQRWNWLVFPEEQRTWARKLYDYLFTSPTIGPAVETPVRRADGTERIVESSYTFLTHNGSRTAMLSIIRNITERKKAEEALRERELKLHLALEVADMGTWDWDILSNEISWSANMEQRKDTFIGMASHELKTPLTTLKAITHLRKKKLEK